jgi:hypothetical protein
LILLCTPSSFLKLVYTGSLWKAWTALRDFLIFYPDGCPIPGHWSVADLARVLNEIQLASSASILELAAIMGRIGCRRVLQMWDHELHTWKALNHKLARVRGLTNESLHFVQSFIWKLEHNTVDEQDASLTPGHWRWSDQNTERMEAFILPNRQAYLFLFPQDFTHQRLNSIWEVTLEEGEWQTFWHALWQSNLTTTAKVFLWRILAQGLFTGSRAITIKIGDGRCLACPGIVKTIPHLFATCPYA